ncbi:hypothetical protein CBS9595_001209 [Malassezia furfur]|nr:hypothetical protein CBS9595_001209 [Malassezia furfur]
MAMVSCPLLGTNLGLVPECYSRNIDINNTIIFQPATCIIHMAALFMTAIMVYHVHCKYTAVGRKEIVFFFYLYGLSELLVLFLDSAVIPTHTGAYRWFTAIYIGLKTCIFWCLMLNGFVGFQFAEDGTPLSLWTLRLSTLVFWVIGFAVSAWTFGDVKNGQGGLWFFEFIFPIIMVAIYIVSQVVLVVRTLDDFWAINDIALGTIAYVAGIILMFGFNNQICESVKHYIDGTFFISLCMLFAVMMVYKFWDDITKEDLEFSVGSKHSAWDTKEPLVSSDFDGSMLSHDFGRSSVSTRAYSSRPPSPPRREGSANLFPSNRAAPNSATELGAGLPQHR